MLPSQRHHFTLLLLLSCCCCFLSPIECRSRDKENRRRNEKMSPSLASSATSSSTPTSANYYGSGGSGGGGGGGSIGNIAGISGSSSSASASYVRSTYERTDRTDFCKHHRKMKLMCHCTPEENHLPVLKAECWIFADPLLQSDETWSLFYQQKRLRELKFYVRDTARFDYIPTMILESLKNLTTITIEYAQIEVVKSNAFANLQHLERIILTNNQIIELKSNAFANHIQLRELKLESNQITDINRNAFHNLPQCEQLLLNDNNLTILHDGIFASMIRLKYLNLANNQISVLTSDVFKGLGYLNILKLTHNNLNFIGDKVFTELWSLVELELDDNRIERISGRGLDGLNNLKTLNLRNNQLKKIDNGLLHGTPALMSLNVQNNHLETLTAYAFQPMMDTFVNNTSELLLADNNFICDCRLKWIFDLRNRTHQLSLRDTLEDIICTLQEPKLSNFVKPVPSHILDLLNIGGYSSNVVSNGPNSGRNRQSKTRKMQMRSQSQLASSQMELVEVELAKPLHNTQTQMKRSISSMNSGGGMIGGTETSDHRNVAGDDDAAYKYFDDIQANMMSQQMEHSDEFDRGEQQNDLFHYTARPTKQFDDDTIDNSALPKETLGFKVRLFTLIPKNLPCPDEIADPTELPLSRDLVDLRSNLINSSESIGNGLRYTVNFAIVFASITFSQHFVLCLE